MYLLTLRDGRTLKFSVHAVAELYRDLYGGKLELVEVVLE